MSETDDAQLGQISTGPRQTKLNTPTDRLELPRKAVIAFRQSGGLRFSTREVIVYNDGRVIARWQGKLGTGEGSRRITRDEVMHLKDLIKQSSFFELPLSIGRSSPDGYAYELIARIDRKPRSIEFFDGSIPAKLRPLLAQLKTFSSMDAAQE